MNRGRIGAVALLAALAIAGTIAPSLPSRRKPAARATRSKDDIDERKAKHAAKLARRAIRAGAR